MRLSLNFSVDSRDGSSTKDARLTNVLIEKDEGEPISAVRPGLTLNASNGASNGQGLVNFNGTLIAIQSGLLYKPSGGAFGSSTALPSASTTLMFDFTQSPT